MNTKQRYDAMCQEIELVRICGYDVIRPTAKHASLIRVMDRLSGVARKFMETTGHNPWA